MRLDEVELVHVELPLVRPFATGRATTSAKHAVLVHVIPADAPDGWGECTAELAPTYAPEYLDGAWRVLRDYLVPRALAGAPFDDIAGNHMARAALEMALLDASLRQEGTPLAQHLGGTRDRVPSGVVVELHDDPYTAAAVAAKRVAEGYRRIKLKIAPGRDLAHAAATRAAIGTDVPLWADANGAYSLDDLGLLRVLDVDLLEQPLRAGDLVDHAELASLLSTPICLDESIGSLDDARAALRLRATDVVTIKAGRVGGLNAARAIHDLCHNAAVPVWCGGMLETGIGRAANVALASLPGFTLPGDISASNRYYAEDLTEPFELGPDGCIAVPRAPGLGVVVDTERVGAATVRSERFSR
jgi:o-succinylbenzoate synthase